MTGHDSKDTDKHNIGHINTISHLLPSGLYRRHLDFTDSTGKTGSRAVTAGRGITPRPEDSILWKEYRDFRRKSNSFFKPAYA